MIDAYQCLAMTKTFSFWDEASARWLNRGLRARVRQRWHKALILFRKLHIGRRSFVSSAKVVPFLFR